MLKLFKITVPCSHTLQFYIHFLCDCIKEMRLRQDLDFSMHLFFEYKKKKVETPLFRWPWFIIQCKLLNLLSSLCAANASEHPNDCQCPRSDALSLRKLESIALRERQVSNMKPLESVSLSESVKQNWSARYSKGTGGRSQTAFSPTPTPLKLIMWPESSCLNLTGNKLHWLLLVADHTKLNMHGCGY